MANFLTLADLAFAHKIVLLRADLNVPMKEGRVSDDARLQALLPTLRTLAKAQAKIVVLSHFGRPKNGADCENSLRPVAEALALLWGKPVAFADDCIGASAKQAIDALAFGDVLVLENTRFHGGEEANDPAFVAALASLGDVFVNDAFSAAHRAHASTTGLAHALPAAAGLLMQAELEALHKALDKPERPLAAIVGGAKISTKLELLNNLLSRVEVLVLGGAMANTFLAAKGMDMGKSLTEPEMFETARNIMKEAEAKGRYILLPKDVVVAEKFAAHAPSQIVSINAVPAGSMALDLGPETVAEIKSNLAMCKTVVWNGPLGAFEIPPFDKATTEVAIGVADLTKRGKILSVAGGGDTVAAMKHAGTEHGVSYLSLAGGAFLEWLEGKELPGVAALLQAVPAQKAGRVIM